MGCTSSFSLTVPHALLLAFALWITVQLTLGTPVSLSGGQGDLAALGNDDINHDAQEEFDAFISYRRSVSRHFAMLIKILLEKENINAYLDVEDLDGGPWASQLMNNIDNSPNFILMLGNGTLERCKNDFNYTDFLHQEIKAAVDAEKRIVLVLDDFDWPSSELFSDEINTALSNQGIVWQFHLAEQSLQRLIRYLEFPNATVVPELPSNGDPKIFGSLDGNNPYLLLDSKDV